MAGPDLGFCHSFHDLQRDLFHALIWVSCGDQGRPDFVATAKAQKNQIIAWINSQPKHRERDGKNFREMSVIQHVASQHV